MRRTLLLVILGLVLIASPAGTQTPEERAARLSERIMSPFCDGVTLHDCPSAEADELRREIAQMARDGMSDEEIIDRLEAEFGPGIRATPEDAASWLLPAIAGALGLVVVGLLAKRWASTPKRSQTSEPDHPEISAEDRARLDAELAAYRGEV